MKRPGRKKHTALHIVSVSLTVLAALAIFLLTAQDARGTVSLTHRMAADLPWAFPKRSDPLWLSLGLNNPRRLAHIYEFFVLGGSVSAALHSRQGAGILPGTGAGAAICLCCSVLDQLHKVIVPGRHFDLSDLLVDAVGYLTAIGLAALIAWAIKRIKKRDAPP